MATQTLLQFTNAVEHNWPRERQFDENNENIDRFSWFRELPLLYWQVVSIFFPANGGRSDLGLLQLEKRLSNGSRSRARKVRAKLQQFVFESVKLSSLGFKCKIPVLSWIIYLLQMRKLDISRYILMPTTFAPREQTTFLLRAYADFHHFKFVFDHLWSSILSPS